MTDKPASKDPILRALHEARKAQGLTLLDVAERMGRVTSQSPCHWENGKRSPSLVNLHDWAGALGYELTLTPRLTRHGPGCEARSRHSHYDPGWVCTGQNLIALFPAPTIEGLFVVCPEDLLQSFMTAPWADDVYDPHPFVGGDHLHAVLEPKAKP